jgi:hypothetical protein
MMFYLLFQIDFDMSKMNEDKTEEELEVQRNPVLWFYLQG